MEQRVKAYWVGDGGSKFGWSAPVLGRSKHRMCRRPRFAYLSVPSQHYCARGWAHFAATHALREGPRPDKAGNRTTDAY